MFTLIVKATDKGTPTQSSNPHATIKITVIDVNEHSPEITNLPGTKTVSENEKVGFEIFTVLVIDKDTADLITITIETTGPFRIEEGVIITTGELDRETEGTYTIRVTATDGTFTDVQTLTITVGDVNDQKPTFTVKDQTVTVSEDEPVGFECATVIATDGDLGSNAVVMYIIKSGNDDDSFAVDMVNGNVL